ncbi:3-phosphoserine/phosphohydroxythreonine transaminase [Candidatus Riesia pediculicola]|uniref:3-phosphoserine/phosphohydroxythreonine transaminase n=1 Tax=Candidatus Riesia pediculicola TaxID=401619 RepID=UPI0009C3CD54|nr:3-phosphoserine/phosphohydroxythreonine transaminase [Candidatus Riesia pediculicola]ARC54166.1 3-phosphoserine/phosphohydroxythreonine aminotransferase [Candidatus Riesia pediculicola]
MNKRIYNFSAGPSCIPKEVLKQIKKESACWKKSNVSVMEISHRSETFLEISNELHENIRKTLNIPKNYEILLLHGGARGMFSAIPLNLFQKREVVDYVIGGYWSNYAYREASRYCSANAIYINTKTKDNKKIDLIPVSEWKLSNSKYLHLCHNETVEGIKIDLSNDEIFKKKIVIADFSSSILSEPLNISNFGLIYASSQKNIGISGIVLVIIRKDLVKESCQVFTPSILNFFLQTKHHSLYNTPNTFSWYVSTLIFRWIMKNGGLQKIKINNQKKSNLLYDTLDKSHLYINDINPKYRSTTNVTFRIHEKGLNEKFIELSEKSGLLFLRGHRVMKGMRASIYNSMPFEGVKKLSNFMKDFENQYFPKRKFF